MNNIQRNQWHLALCAGLGFTALALSAAPSAGGQIDSRTAALVASLDAAGFKVQEGTVEVAQVFQMVNDHKIDSAAGNNAGQYYKRFVVPPPPSHYGGLDNTFRLRPDEAVVYVGKTPPQADYFSFCPFLFTRQYPDSVPLTGDLLFASVVDPLNHKWIRTEGGEKRFEQNTIVVLTADEGVYGQILELAGSAGFPASMVNPLVLPSSILHLGTHISSDTFQVLVRTANIASQVDERKYLAADDWARIYRVTPRIPPALQPFEQPPWRDRTCPDEETLRPGITEGLERLKQAILAKTAYEQASSLDSVQAVHDSSEVLDPNSPAYRQSAMGESSDTPYRRTAQDGVPVNFLLGNDDMVVVYGVNHAATGIATYSSFGVYGDWHLNHCPPEEGEPRFIYGAGDPIWNGVASMTCHQFAGSAEQYLPGDPMAPYLYAIRVVRKARREVRDPYCLVVPELKDSKAREPFYPDVIPLDKPMMVGFRAYLNPETGAGPSYEAVIPDRAIWFKMR